MGGAKSVFMPGIHMKRMEKNCVAPLNSKLCKHYVADDTITTRKKNATTDKLFANMNSHKNIKLTVESSTTRFLDTTFNVNPDDSVTTKSFENLENFQPFGTFKYLKSTRGII